MNVWGLVAVILPKLSGIHTDFDSCETDTDVGDRSAVQLGRGIGDWTNRRSVSYR